MEKPLILVTNDDGIGSEGLWAAVEAVLPLGEVLVVAPDRQWSGGEMDHTYHLTGDNAADYSATKVFTQQFARLILAGVSPWDVDALNINVPADATPDTPWRLTRLSRRRYFVSTPPDRANGMGRPGYRVIENIQQTEPESDVRAVMVDRVVSVTPLSLDLTSRIDSDSLTAWLDAEWAVSRSEFLPLFLGSSSADHDPIMANAVGV